MRRGLAISMLKQASVSGAATELAESGGHILRGAGKAVKGVFGAAGDVGEAFARGAGADPSVGRVLGQAGLVGAGYLGTQRARRKKDEWMYMHNFMG